MREISQLLAGVLAKHKRKTRGFVLALSEGTTPTPLEELRYMREEQLLAVLQSEATVGVEFSSKSFITKQNRLVPPKPPVWYRTAPGSGRLPLGGGPGRFGPMLRSNVHHVRQREQVELQ